jgi:hypothetical protein
MRYACKAALAAFLSTTSAYAMSIEERYKLCKQRHHSNCEERVALARKYGYWINAYGAPRDIKPSH